MKIAITRRLLAQNFNPALVKTALPLCSAVALVLSGCSLSGPDRSETKRVQISLPGAGLASVTGAQGSPSPTPTAPANSGAGASASVNEFSPVETIRSIDEFQCFGINMTGPNIPADARAPGTCSEETLGTWNLGSSEKPLYGGKFIGLFSRTQGSVEIEIPKGENVTFQLFAVRSKNGCPNINELLDHQNGGNAGIDEPFELARTSVTISADATVNLAAAWSSERPKPMFCHEKRRPEFKATATWLETLPAPPAFTSTPKLKGTVTLGEGAVGSPQRLFFFNDSNCRMPAGMSNVADFQGGVGSTINPYARKIDDGGLMNLAQWQEPGNQETDLVPHFIYARVENNFGHQSSCQYLTWYQMAPSQSSLLVNTIHNAYNLVGAELSSYTISGTCQTGSAFNSNNALELFYLNASTPVSGATSTCTNGLFSFTNLNFSNDSTYPTGTNLNFRVQYAGVSPNEGVNSSSFYLTKSAGGGGLSISPSTVSIALGATQTFTATGGSGSYTFSLSGQDCNTSGGTIVSTSGIMTAPTTAPPGTCTVTVLDTNNNSLTATATVTIVAANNHTSYSSISVTTPAAGSANATATITLKDDNNVGISNVSVGLSITGISGSGASGYCSNPTNSSGQTSCNINAYNAGTGSVTINSTTGTALNFTSVTAASVTFIPSISANNSTVHGPNGNVGPNAYSVSMGSSFAVKVTVRDQFNQTMPGFTVNLTKSNLSGTTETPTSVTSNANGEAIFTITNATRIKGLLTAYATNGSSYATIGTSNPLEVTFAGTGDMDPNFGPTGSSGAVLLQGSSNFNSATYSVNSPFIEGLAVESGTDGKIYAFGWNRSSCCSTPGYEEAGIIARASSASGTVDSGFETSGMKIQYSPEARYYAGIRGANSTATNEYFAAVGAYLIPADATSTHSTYGDSGTLFDSAKSRGLVTLYDNTGAAVTGFGGNSNGSKYLPSTGTTKARLNAVAIDSANNKIYVGGTSYSTSSTLSTGDSYIAALDFSGALVTAFGTGGEIVSNQSTSFEDQINGIEIDTGSVVVAGTKKPGDTNSQAFALKYSSTGTLQNFPSTSGPTLPPGTEIKVLKKVTGGYLLGGTQKATTNSTWWVTKISTTGAIATSFGTGGTFTHDWSPIVNILGESVYAITEQPDGKFLIAGAGTDSTNTSRRVPAVIRLNSTGTIDTTFGNNGTNVYPAYYPDTSIESNWASSIQYINRSSSDGIVIGISGTRGSSAPYSRAALIGIKP